MTQNLITKSVGYPQIDSGQGSPDHNAPIGSIYIDSNSGISYINTKYGSPTGWTEMTIQNNIITVSAVTSYTATTYGYYFVDTSIGDVTVYIPDSDSGNISKMISVRKESLSDGNYVNVSTMSGQLFDNGANTFSVYKTEHGFTVLSIGTEWNTIQDDRTGKYKIFVGNENSDFTTIQDAITWCNSYLPVSADIYVKSGIYYIDDTVTITNNNIQSIRGDGYFTTVIHPTIELTGKTMFDIKTGTLLADLFIDGSNLGTGTGNTYRNTSGSIAINYDSTTRVYFDNLRINYVYNVLNLPKKTETCKINLSVFLYIGGDGIIINNGAYLVMVGSSLRYCSGEMIRTKNTLDASPPTKYFAQACRFYGSSTNYTNSILTSEGDSECVLSDCYVQYATSGITSKDTSKIDIMSSNFSDINGYYFNQSDTTSEMTISNTLGLFTTSKTNITNSALFNINGIDNSSHNLLIGNSSDSENVMFEINIGKDSKNPTMSYDALFDDRGLVYEDLDDTISDPSIFIASTYNRNSEMYIVSRGPAAHQKDIEFKLITYEDTVKPTPNTIDWSLYKSWNIVKEGDSQILNIEYVIGQTGQTVFSFMPNGDLILPSSLYLTGETFTDYLLTIDGDRKVVSSGYRIVDLSAHTHANKANLDTINQNMSSTDSVTFNDLTLTESLLYFGTGITLTNNENSLYVRNGTNMAYANLVVQNLTVLGALSATTETVNSISGSTLYFLSGQTSPVSDVFIQVVRGIGYTDATIKWDEFDDKWKFGFLGSEVPMANDDNVVHKTGNEIIFGNKSFENKIIFGTGITSTANLQINYMSNLQNTVIPSDTLGVLVASNSGRTFFLGQNKSSINIGKVDNSGALLDYWTISNEDGANDYLLFRYGTNNDIYNNIDMMYLSKTGKLTVQDVSIVNVDMRYNTSGISFKDSNGNIMADITQYKTFNINNPGQYKQPMSIKPSIRNGIGSIYTSGSSIYAYVTNSGFSNVYTDSIIIANGIERIVEFKTDDNNIQLSEAVNWTDGYSWTIGNNSIISLDGTDLVQKGIAWDTNSDNRWELYTWINENSEFLNLWNERSYKDILSIHQNGRIGINKPTSYVGTQPANDNLSIYPQSFDQIWYYDTVTYTDNTLISRNTALPPFIFLTGTTDYTYVGKYSKFRTILLYIENELTGTSLKFEFYNGSSWVTLTNVTHSLVDNTNGLSVANTVTFDISTMTWVTTTVNGSDELYYIRISATSITEPSYMFILSNNGVNRLGVYCAHDDTTPFFFVDYFGRTAIGDNLTKTRLTSGTLKSRGRSLGVIDTNASVRIWQYDTKTSTQDTLIELIKGDSDILSNNLWYDIRLENSDPIYSQESIIFRNVNTNKDQFLISNVISGTTQIISPISLQLTGNQTKKGMMLELTDINESGSNNQFSFLNIKNNVTGFTSTLYGITICSGLTYGIFSQSNIRTNKQLVSTIATGTAPLSITSKTLVSNLNVQYLNGFDSNQFSLTSHTHTDLYLSLSGGTITGNLSVTGNITGTTLYSTTLNNTGLIITGTLSSGNITGTTLYSTTLNNTGLITTGTLSSSNITGTTIYGDSIISTNGNYTNLTGSSLYSSTLHNTGLITTGTLSSGNITGTTIYSTTLNNTGLITTLNSNITTLTASTLYSSNSNITSLTATTIYSNNEINTNLITSPNASFTDLTATTLYSSTSNITTGNIITVNSTTVNNTSNVNVSGLTTLNTLTLRSGSTTVFGISTNSALTENSDSYLSTQKAIKTLVDYQVYFNYDAARAGNNNAPVDLNRNGVATSTTPFIVPYNATLIAISISTSAVNTWIGAVYVNGSSVASVSVTGAASGYNGTLLVNVNAGDAIRLRLDANTGTINNPAITAYFKRR